MKALECHRASTMRVLVETCMQEAMVLAVKSSDTLDSIKEKIQNRIGVPRNEQMLFFEGMEIANGRATCAEQKILNKSRLLLVRGDACRRGVAVHLHHDEASDLFLMPERNAQPWRFDDLVAAKTLGHKVVLPAVDPVDGEPKRNAREVGRKAAKRARFVNEDMESHYDWPGDGSIVCRKCGRSFGRKRGLGVRQLAQHARSCRRC